jgi:hypothetical protein
MANEVSVLKLTTGEEIITRMSVEEDGTLLLEKPMVLQQMGADASGAARIGLVPWSFAGNVDKVTLDSKHVLASLESNLEISKNYLSAVTGIAL